MLHWNLQNTQNEIGKCECIRGFVAMHTRFWLNWNGIMAAPTLALYAHSTQCTLILLLKANSKTTENEPFRWKIYGSFNCNIMHTGINSCCVNRPNRQIYDLCPRSFSLSVLFSFTSTRHYIVLHKKQHPHERKKRHICTYTRTERCTEHKWCAAFFSVQKPFIF